MVGGDGLKEVKSGWVGKGRFDHSAAFAELMQRCLQLTDVFPPQAGIARRGRRREAAPGWKIAGM
jgi:hypothetical protein